MTGWEVPAAEGSPVKGDPYPLTITGIFPYRPDTEKVSSLPRLNEMDMKRYSSSTAYGLGPRVSAYFLKPYTLKDTFTLAR